MSPQNMSLVLIIKLFPSLIGDELSKKRFLLWKEHILGLLFLSKKNIIELAINGSTMLNTKLMEQLVNIKQHWLPKDIINNKELISNLFSCGKESDS